MEHFKCKQIDILVILFELKHFTPNRIQMQVKCQKPIMKKQGQPDYRNIVIENIIFYNNLHHWEKLGIVTLSCCIMDSPHWARLHGMVTNNFFCICLKF